MQTTGASALQYVARWTGAAQDAPSGVHNPIWYGAVEVGADGTPEFFAGEAYTVELCSVSGCFPHAFEYPRPPLGGTAIKGKLIDKDGTTPDIWRLKIPLRLVGGAKEGSLLESFSVFAFARPRSAATAPSNSEAEGDIMPVMIDGICCSDAVVRPRA
jgi:hypothetical protein